MGGLELAARNLSSWDDSSTRFVSNSPGSSFLMARSRFDWHPLHSPQLLRRHEPHPQISTYKSQMAPITAKRSPDHQLVGRKRNSTLW